MQLDRRTTFRILAAAAAGSRIAAGQAPPAARLSADQELQSARADLRDSAQRIARVNLPRSVEPAFSFRA